MLKIEKLCIKLLVNFIFKLINYKLKGGNIMKKSPLMQVKEMFGDNYKEEIKKKLNLKNAISNKKALMLLKKIKDK